MNNVAPRPEHIVFLHLDDRAVEKYNYTESNLVEGLLLNILYFDRVFVPANLLLANPQINSMFLHKRKISDVSLIGKLVKQKAVVPVVFNQKFSGIGEYARAALERKVPLISGVSPRQWLERADFLDELGIVSKKSGNFGSQFSESVMSMFQDTQVLQAHIRPFSRATGNTVSELIRAFSNSPDKSRGTFYNLTDKINSKRVRLAIQRLVDAIYYGVTSDYLGLSPAIPVQCGLGTLQHFDTSIHSWRLDFGSEVRYQTSFPRLAAIGIDQIYQDLATNDYRVKWLNAYKHLANNKLNVRPEDVFVPLREWTDFLLKYLRSDIPTSERAKIERKLTLKMGLIQAGKRILFVYGLSQTVGAISNILGTIGLDLGGRVLDASKADLDRTRNFKLYGTLIPQAPLFKIPLANTKQD